MKEIKTSQEKPSSERHYRAANNASCSLSGCYAFIRGPENKLRKSQACEEKACFDKSQHAVIQLDVFPRNTPKSIQGTNGTSLPNRSMASFLLKSKNVSKEANGLAVSGRALNLQPIDGMSFAFSAASVKSGTGIQRNAAIRMRLPWPSSPRLSL